MGRPRPHRLPRGSSSDGSAIAGAESFWEAKCNITEASCGVESIPATTFLRPGPRLSQLCWSRRKLTIRELSQRCSGRVDSVVYAKNAAQHYLLVVAYEEAKYRDTFETEIDREPTYSVRQLVLNPAGTTVTTVRELYRGQVALLPFLQREQLQQYRPTAHRPRLT